MGRGKIGPCTFIQPVQWKGNLLSSFALGPEIPPEFLNELRILERILNLPSRWFRSIFFSLYGVPSAALEPELADPSAADDSDCRERRPP